MTLFILDSFNSSSLRFSSQSFVPGFGISLKNLED